MHISLIILITVISLYFLSKTLKEVKELFPYVSLSGLFKKSKIGSVENPEENTARSRYDVNAFRERMSKLRESMDEDGLYEVEEVPPVTDFTGTEIISEQFEMDLDYQIRRK